MKTLIAFALSAAFFAVSPAAGQTETVYEPMKPFAVLAGRTLRGEGTAPDGTPVVDIAQWEMILGGRAFQSTHRLEGSTYGGRTIFFYDEGAQKYVFHYFTTAGFHTTGEIVLTDDGFEAIEIVEGHPDFVEVRSRAVVSDEDVKVESRHRKRDGSWTEGEGFIYRDAPGAVVSFE